MVTMPTIPKEVELLNMLGMFDSGSGGLTVLHAIRNRMPHIGVIYFGDILNAPYGVKSVQELEALTRSGVALLKQKGATTLVSACNSVSSSVLAGAAGEMPFVEMSIPTAEYMKQYQGKRFLLIATPATVNSGLYTKVLGNILSLDSVPIQELAGAIEFEYPAEKIQKIINNAFSLRRGEQYDGLILGCTHYPLVLDLITKIAHQYFGAIEIIDPAYAVAEKVEKTVPFSEGPLVFLTSKKSEPFEKRVTEMFPADSSSISIDF